MPNPIRRHYVLPLRPGATPAAIDELLAVLREADRHIPGLLDSSAALDERSETVVWENSFVDEAAYSGPYMEHPYHVAAIDDFLMPDSPCALVMRSYAVRFQIADASQPLRSGIRRIVLLSLEDEPMVEAVAAMAAAPDNMTTSIFAADDVGWVSGKGRAWTHIWEQGFTDTAQLERHLASTEASTADSLTTLGIDPDAVAVFTCPFELAPPDEQSPPPMPPDDGPVLYSLTHRVAPGDEAALTDALEGLYDPFMTEHGAPLVQRFSTIDGGYGLAEIESTWRLESLGAYNELRSGLATATGWMQFLAAAAPIVKGGRRRFHRLDQ